MNGRDHDVHVEKLDRHFGRHFEPLLIIFRSVTGRQTISHTPKPLYTKFHIFSTRTTVGQLVFTFFKILTCLQQRRSSRMRRHHREVEV